MKPHLKNSLRWLLPLFLVGVTSLVYWNVLGADFVTWDDQILVYENPLIDPAVGADWGQFWRQAYLYLYMPLTYSAWAVLAQMSWQPNAGSLGGDTSPLNPQYFHVANLIVHLANVILVFSLMRMLVKRDIPALCGAALFALHPVQVESVAWISELKGLLCGFFALLALNLHCRQVLNARSTDTIPASRSRFTGAFPVLSALCYLLAWLCKPAALGVPIIAFVLDRFMLQRPTWVAFKSLSAWWLIAALFVLVSIRVQPPVPSAVTPLWTRPLVAADALAFYFGKLLAPVSLGVDYGRTPATVLAGPGYIAILVTLLGLGAIFVFGRQRIWLAAGCLIFILAVLPVLGLVPFRFQFYSTVADRYLYLALLGPALILAFAMEEIKFKFFKPMVLSGLCVLAGLTLVQTTHWHNSWTLFSHAYRLNPRSWASLNNMGSYLQKHNQPDEAMQYFESTVKFNPSSSNAWYGMGLLSQRRGRTDDALRFYKNTVQAEAGHNAAWNNMGIIYAERRNFEQATLCFENALRYSPSPKTEVARNAAKNLAMVRESQGR